MLQSLSTVVKERKVHPDRDLAVQIVDHLLFQIAEHLRQIKRRQANELGGNIRLDHYLWKSVISNSFLSAT